MSSATITSVRTVSPSELDITFTGGSLINVVAGENVVSYHGPGTPTTARFYLHKSIIASDGTIVNKGAPYGPLKGFYQPFTVSSFTGGVITLASGNLYSTTDSTDPTGQIPNQAAFAATVTGDLLIFGANNELLCTALKNVKIPTTPNPITWAQIRAAG